MSQYFHWHCFRLQLDIQVFLGSIGHIIFLMNGSALKEVLELTYANNVVTYVVVKLCIEQYELECQAVDENNANESTETLESRYEDIDTADNNVNQNKEIKTLRSTLKSMISDESSNNELSQSDFIKCVKEKTNSLKSSVSQSRTGALWIQYMEMIDILRSFIKGERFQYLDSNVSVLSLALFSSTA